MLHTLSDLTSYYDSEEDVVVTSPVGEISRVNLQVTIRKALEVAKDNNCHYLLFDICDCTVNRSFMEGFTDMTNFGALMGMSVEYNCAVQYDVKTYPEERAQLIESVANTMINPPFKMFKDKCDAMNWLRTKQIKRSTV